MNIASVLIDIALVVFMLYLWQKVVVLARFALGLVIGTLVGSNVVRFFGDRLSHTQGRVLVLLIASMAISAVALMGVVEVRRMIAKRREPRNERKIALARFHSGE
jgi:hypothetical protein